MMKPTTHSFFFLSLLAGAAAAPLGCGDSGGDDKGGGGEGAKDSIGLPGGPAGGGEGGNTGDGACGTEEVEGDRIAANLLLVVDTSGSMDDKPQGFSMNKWKTLVGSLETALPEVDTDVRMGLKLFPSGGGDQCGVSSGVEEAIGDENASAINSAVAKITPDGATPTAQALKDALAYFQGDGAMSLDGENYVLLATDGGPNCNDTPDVDCTCTEEKGPADNPSCGAPDRCTTNIDAASGNACALDTNFGSCCVSDQEHLCLDDAGTLDAVQDLKDAGVTTIVLGMPGSEAYTTVLDQLADAGGLPASDSSPKYYNVDDPDGLTDTLRSITRALIRTCEIQLTEAPPDRGLVNVYIDGNVIPKDDDDGWRYEESTTPVSVVLTGPTCEAVESEGAKSISIRFGCPTETVR